MDDYLGMIRIFPWNWAPQGYALCNGASLPVNQNAALSALLGTNFGGNATNFNLPNLQNAVPIGTGTHTTAGVNYSYIMGNHGGVDAAPLAVTQIPQHSHLVAAYNQYDLNNNSPIPDGGTFGTPDTTGFPLYSTTMQSPVPLLPASVSSTGGGATPTHPNDQPSLVVNYCICTAGYFPSRS